MFKQSSPSHAAANPDLLDHRPEGAPVATFAGGCFWCLESEFRPIPGVLFVESGYTGGTTENPTYEQISTGRTGHAEANRIYFDPAKVSYNDLLEHFMTRAHDPTQVNKQWVDEGTQYRSAVFYHDEGQKQATEALFARLTAEKRFKNPIATEINPAVTFWPAEDYHQNYYEKYEEKNGKEHIRVLLKQQMKNKK